MDIFEKIEKGAFGDSVDKIQLTIVAKLAYNEGVRDGRRFIQHLIEVANEGGYSTEAAQEFEDKYWQEQQDNKIT